MSVIPFVDRSLRELHQDLGRVVGGLTLEQFHWRPTPQTNHIAFVVWHYARTEDNIVRFIAQRRPTVWMEEGWDKRFGLDSRAQGTGMKPEDVGGIRFSAVEEFCDYMGRVFQETERFVAGLMPADLERGVRFRRGGAQEVEEVPLEYLLRTPLLTHGYSHLGEIWVLRGLQGLQGASG